VRIARLVIGDEIFLPVASPFDRPAEPSRCPYDEREFGVERAARSEIAADILHDDAHLFRRDAKHHRQIAPRADRAAGPGIQRVAAALRVVVADRGARFHRHAGDARDPGVEPHDMRGAREGRFGRDRVADIAVEDDVREVLAHPRRARFGRGERMRDRR
jgi:hypothetical protein